MLKLQSGIASSKKVVPWILCGGVGKRVWPLSSDKMPKQFLKIASEHSSLQETIKRFTSNCFKKPIIMTALQYEKFVEKDLLELEVDYEIIFLEENQRNTAIPSILAALYIELIYGDALMLIAPSDHYISPNFAMNSVIEQAVSFTEDRVVIFGIKPNSPSTEYGYIRVGNIIKHYIAYEVKSFKEKPDIESAISYIQSWEYFWNSGYFLVKASKYLSVIYDLEPEILRYCKEVFADKVKNKMYNLRTVNTEYVESSINSNRLQRMNFAYENIECLGIASSQSIDEILSKSRCELITMVELKEIEWADLGSWKSRFEVSKKDEKNNFIAGNVLADQV